MVETEQHIIATQSKPRIFKFLECEGHVRHAGKHSAGGQTKKIKVPVGPQEAVIIPQVTFMFWWRLPPRQFRGSKWPKCYNSYFGALFGPLWASGILSEWTLPLHCALQRRRQVLTPQRTYASVQFEAHVNLEKANQCEFTEASLCDRTMNCHYMASLWKLQHVSKF